MPLGAAKHSIRSAKVRQYPPRIDGRRLGRFVNMDAQVTDSVTHRKVQYMLAILGIDAAWTLTQPSGVALVAKHSTGWRLMAAEPSYQHFLARTDRSLLAEERPSGSPPDASALLASAAMLSGGAIDLVAVDMPLARSPIVERRFSDNKVSRAYGGRKCGTHSPNATRPGRMSDDLNQRFKREGYPLQTIAFKTPGLIEVYPHPTLVELADAKERLPYKASKVGAYWPKLKPPERRARLYQQWDEIVDLLEGEIAGVAVALPRLGLDASGVKLKACEDALDAIVCAWVGICALEGRAKPFGDENSAIWIPIPGATTANAPL
jgi:predicted RNase H-like nuclease